MRKQDYLLLTCFTLFKLSAQISDCPSKNQRGYSCGNIQENILGTLYQQDYEIKSHFNVRLVNSFDSQSDIDRANKIIALCNQVLNDSDFWNALENYNNYKYSVFEKTQDKEQISGIQIINALINGNPDDSNRPLEVDINLTIELYGLTFKTPFESAVAKEIGDGKIYNKKWFFKYYPIDDIGANWIHEFSHTKGLIHCYYCNQERDYSIPYVINRIFSEVSKKYITHY